MTSSVPPPRIRIDKWLWAVRIFKTRSLSHHAIRAGHIRLNDERIKPSHSVAIGDRIDILQGNRSLTIVVDSVTSIRSSAPIAQTHYSETEESLRRRSEEKTSNAGTRIGGRPTKQDRRRIDRLRDTQ